MTAIPPSPATSLADDITAHLLHTVAVDAARASTTQTMQALAQVLRAQLAERWVLTQNREREAKARRVVYLSMEFLIGRSLSNALAALGNTAAASAGLQAHARTLEDVAATEPDAALGNGGLGRLAACFLDAMATNALPSFGYGIRYEYGMFAQEIHDGRQIEQPEPWLQDGTPWEFPRADIAFAVRFGGWVEQVDGNPVWRHADQVIAKAYDMVVPGHGNQNVRR